MKFGLLSPNKVFIFNMISLVYLKTLVFLLIEARTHTQASS